MRDLRARRSAHEPLHQCAPLPLGEPQGQTTRRPVVPAPRTAASATLQEPGLPIAAPRTLHDELVHRVTRCVVRCLEWDYTPTSQVALTSGVFLDGTSVELSSYAFQH